jgi:hypothetical protein
LVKVHQKIKTGFTPVFIFLCFEYPAGLEGGSRFARAKRFAADRKCNVSLHGKGDN